MTDNNEFLFQKVDNSTWRRHLCIPHRHHSFHTEFMLMHTPPNITLRRATVSFIRNTIQLLSTSYNQNYSTQEDIFSISNINYKLPKVEWFSTYLKKHILHITSSSMYPTKQSHRSQ